MNAEWIRRQKDRFPTTLWMSQGTRGAMIGRLEGTIKIAADAAHLPIDSNCRDIRLRLATQAFGREVATFNDLSHAELWALDRWVLERRAEQELGDWLKANYGEQLRLMEE